jgi:hypothetical protein
MFAKSMIRVFGAGHLRAPKEADTIGSWQPMKLDVGRGCLGGLTSHIESRKIALLRDLVKLGHCLILQALPHRTCGFGIATMDAFLNLLHHHLT